MKIIHYSIVVKKRIDDSAKSIDDTKINCLLLRKESVYEKLEMTTLFGIKSI
jgi:hypothetical protein